MEEIQMESICAWCGKIFGTHLVKANEMRTSISHGICNTCGEILLESASIYEYLN